jgi:hypothetical protein
MNMDDTSKIGIVAIRTKKRLEYYLGDIDSAIQDLGDRIDDLEPEFPMLITEQDLPELEEVEPYKLGLILCDIFKDMKAPRGMTPKLRTIPTRIPQVVSLEQTCSICMGPNTTFADMHPEHSSAHKTDHHVICVECADCMLRLNPKASCPFCRGPIEFE